MAVFVRFMLLLWSCPRLFALVSTEKVDSSLLLWSLALRLGKVVLAYFAAGLEEGGDLMCTGKRTVNHRSCMWSLCHHRTPYGML